MIFFPGEFKLSIERLPLAHVAPSSHSKVRKRKALAGYRYIPYAAIPNLSIDYRCQSESRMTCATFLNEKRREMDQTSGARGGSESRFGEVYQFGAACVIAEGLFSFGF